LTATAVHITDHSGYVQAVVNLNGPSLTSSQVGDHRPRPIEPHQRAAGVLPAGRQSRSLVTAHGPSVRVVEVRHGLSVGIGGLPGAFMYLSDTLQAPTIW